MRSLPPGGAMPDSMAVHMLENAVSILARLALYGLAQGPLVGALLLGVGQHASDALAAVGAAQGLAHGVGHALLHDIAAHGAPAAAAAVVVIGPARLARSAGAGHQPAVAPVVELAREREVPRFGLGAGPVRVLKHPYHPLLVIHGNDGGHAAGHDHARVAYSPPFSRRISMRRTVWKRHLPPRLVRYGSQARTTSATDLPTRPCARPGGWRRPPPR